MFQSLENVDLHICLVPAVYNLRGHRLIVLKA